MAKLVIEGNPKYLKIIAQENRLRASKYGLGFTFSEDKPENINSGGKIKAVDAIEAIMKAENMEDLKKFEFDNRATVAAAFKAREAELDLV